MPPWLVPLTPGTGQLYFAGTFGGAPDVFWNVGGAGKDTSAAMGESLGSHAAKRGANASG
jgi:hypothetical protein